VRFWKTVGPSGADILSAGMHEAGKRCTELLEKTANALNDNVVNVMLLAVQKKNLELSINVAVTKACTMIKGGEAERGKVIGKCVAAFPYMWFYRNDPVSAVSAQDDESYPYLSPFSFVMMIFLIFLMIVL